ncbi:MAG: lipid-A-disaccharide synthase [Flavobacterium sp. BFFFF2]|nr:MAG: lipid-A-disaccharide synthase [Flavobacterium sp. BFFFF2]
MKYYIIAGEASGDLHGSNLMRALYQEDPIADIRFWGGNLMQEVGGTLVKHYKELAFMGFVEVIANLKTIFNNIRFCKDDIEQFQPDALIFIDYPGFNMRIARWAKQKGIPTHYYISPQIWAWKENRIKAIRRDFDHLYVILPFEKDFYEQKHHFPVHFVGHPLLDAIYQRKPLTRSVFLAENQLPDKPLIALLPGSRKQEITPMLHEMVGLARSFPDYQFVIAGAPAQELAIYTPFLQQPNVSVIMNRTYDLLAHAHAALVTSGTATLETALFKVPEVVCYRGNAISYQIAKRIITLKYISLVNLIMDAPVVDELIQGDLNPIKLEASLKKILDPAHRAWLHDQYQQLESRLGGPGASARTAKEIVKSMR